IDLALKKTLAKTNPNFRYINTVITDWHVKGLRTKEAIIEYEKSLKHSSKTPAKEASIPQRGNFEQRKYDDDYYNSLYENVGNDK
ncbi:MAG TPA: DnaD domain protein, partial [Clostridia bacterium]|nr:DnaD domain protein [Clostridia bacterium]